MPLVRPATDAPSGPSRPYLSYVHSLRGLAIVVVVGVHVAEVMGWEQARSLLSRLIFALLGNATVAFVFVSGFLFQHLSQNFRYGRYLRKKLATIVVPCLVVSLPILVHQYLRHSGVYAGAHGVNPLVTGLRACLTGAQMPVPLWYVPMIAVIFLMAPVLKRLDEVGHLGPSIIPTLALATFLHRSRGHELVVQSVLYFLPVYLTGMWFSKYRAAALAYVSRHRLAILAVTACLFALEFGALHRRGPIYSLHPFSTEAGILDVDLEVKLLMTILALDWLRRHDDATRAWFAGLGDASFGVFFLHGYAILTLEVLVRRIALALPAGVGAYLFFTTATLAVCYLGVRLAQWTLGARSRYVVGC